MIHHHLRQPVGIALFLSLVFSTWVRVPHLGSSPLGFYWAGMTLWSLFAASLASGVGADRDRCTGLHASALQGRCDAIHQCIEPLIIQHSIALQQCRMSRPPLGMEPNGVGDETEGWLLGRRG